MEALQNKLKLLLDNYAKMEAELTKPKDIDLVEKTGERKQLKA